MGEEWREREEKVNKLREKKKKEKKGNRKRNRRVFTEMAIPTVCKCNYSRSSEMSSRLGLVWPLGSAYTLPSQVQAEV